ncbi:MULTISPECIES: imidazole glycerol phosphate synthase subunit HisF [Corynebacterium]|uniref:imidazole glycerol phosphate synthase subunit HisF n=1 Tax=Corynebacterium TaxID=1716 RepID=UPI00019C22A3|nr:imidazoleglycerol phosphate synthase, cyclase subunit [Corynebacterium glucuronolyticum ATCC 51867]QQU89311.1 imidazole glycerol phosphate synthase subunit HisF [Corynebacterium glucuronolyticum]QRO82966.1 imidazole glycerol phosphate synthase subunit HisF [Corynebacterium glucuronolyticum]
MSVGVRVIPCLDVKDGRVVKGVNFAGLRDAGDPVELAARYFQEGADELTFLDVSATVQGRETMRDVVRKVAGSVFIPLTVGGGVRSVDDCAELLRCGADKVSINSAAVADPGLINQLAERFGRQCVVLSLDARRTGEGNFEITTHGGTRGTGIDAIGWARDAERRGAGEILVNSMDADGTKEGFDLELLRLIREAVSVPIIASGGAGKADHFPPAVETGADAVLAASIFHYGDVSIGAVKRALTRAGYATRPIRTLPEAVAAKVQFNADGLVPAVVQADSGEVLMLAWMDDVALAATIETRRATYWSRSRSEYWVKGETSGHIQEVEGVWLDCDGDTVLLRVKQTGAACHTGMRTCFDDFPVALQ